MAGFKSLFSGPTMVCLELNLKTLSLVQFLVLHIHQDFFVRSFPTMTINIKIYVRINHYLTVGAYVHGVHSEGKKSKRFKIGKLQISKEANFKQC